MVAGRAVARTPWLTFCRVPLPQQVFAGGSAAVRRKGPSSTQAPGEPSYDCVYGPRPVLRGVSGLPSVPTLMKKVPPSEFTSRGRKGINVKNNGISSASPTVLPAAERREDERSENDRSTAAGKTVTPEPPSPPRPDPEVVADAKRRTFTAEYKLRILAEADAAAAQPGA